MNGIDDVIAAARAIQKVQFVQLSDSTALARRAFSFVFLLASMYSTGTMPSKEECHVDIHDCCDRSWPLLRYGSRQKRASSRLAQFQDTLRYQSIIFIGQHSFSYIKGPKHLLKNHIANVLGGRRLDEASGGRVVSCACISGPELHIK